jgi:hypothetical protein
VASDNNIYFGYGQKIMAFDQSIEGFGACLLVQGSAELAKKLSHGGKEGFDRVVTLTEQAAKLVEEYKPDVVVMEGYAFGANTNVLTQLAELGGCLKLGINILGYKPGWSRIRSGERAFLVQTCGQMKKFCLGQDTKKDSGYLLKVMEKLKVRFTDDNIADAYMHAYMASLVVAVLRGACPIGNLPEYQQECLLSAAIKGNKKLTIKKAMKLSDEEKLKLVLAHE